MNPAGGPPIEPPVEPPVEPPGRPAAGPHASEAYGSIIERFRGTEWDTTPDLPEPPRSSRSGMLIPIGAVALVLVGAFTAIGILSQQPAATPVPSRVIPTDPPTPGPAALLLDAFWREVTQPTFSYHVEIRSTVTQGSAKVIESLSLDAHADDYAGTGDMEIKPLLKPLHVVLLRSSGILYTKLRGETAWTNALSAGSLELRTRPFLSLEDPRQLIVSGTAVRDGVVLQRLVSTLSWRPPINRVMPLAIGSAPTATTTLELLVTDDGVPVAATIRIHVPADPAAGEVAADGTATYVFTRVDAVDPIPSPKL